MNIDADQSETRVRAAALALRLWADHPPLPDCRPADEDAAERERWDHCLTWARRLHGAADALDALAGRTWPPAYAHFEGVYLAVRGDLRRLDPGLPVRVTTAPAATPFDDWLAATAGAGRCLACPVSEAELAAAALVLADLFDQLAPPAAPRPPYPIRLAEGGGGTPPEGRYLLPAGLGAAPAAHAAANRTRQGSAANP